jgi:hypothetical protein
MRIIETAAYTFNELSPEIQVRVVESWRVGDFPYHDEIKATLNALQNLFGVTVYNWEYGLEYHTFRIGETSNDKIPAWKVVRDIQLPRKVYRRGYGVGSKYRVSKITRKTIDDCPFTGVCYDFAYADAVRELHKPSNFFTWTKADFVRYVFDRLFSMAVADYKYFYSEESIREDIRCNDFEFTAEGKLI